MPPLGYLDPSTPALRGNRDMTTNRVPDNADAQQLADENHLPARLVRMYKTGLLRGADAVPVVAHLTSCDLCATLLEALPVESAGALRTELLAKVLASANEPAPLALPERARPTHEEVWGKDPARRPNSAQSPLAVAVFFKIPDRATGISLYAHAAAGKIDIEEATDADLAGTIEKTPDGGIRITFPGQYVGRRYRVVAEQFGRTGDVVAKGTVVATDLTVEVQPSASLDLLRDDGWRLRLTLD